MRQLLLAASLCCSFTFLTASAAQLSAQQEVGFIEKFATAPDRRAALKELIPGTEDYFYYHSLHFQNQKQLAEAQSMLDQWRAKFGENANVVRMTARQMLLSYDVAPEATLNYLRSRLGVQLEHAPPSRDRAAALASRLDRQRLDAEQLIAAAIARDRSLSQVATRVLPQLVDHQFDPVQLRAWLQRLDRADFNGLVKRISEELALRDSAGFGWAEVHKSLTLEQLDELLKLQPKLIAHEPFISNYALRLAPPDGTALEEPRELRSYLERLLQFTRRLPASQNSFKAQVLGNLLRLNLREEKFDRALFLEYLALPRTAPYYAVERLRNQPVTLADLAFSMAPQVILPPIGEDTSLVRRTLEHFFQSDEKLDDFAKFLTRDYLERVLAETKILYGADDAGSWYAKLSPAEQKALRERVELLFDARNKKNFTATDTVELTLELKNVPQLLVKVYEVNPRNYYRTLNRPLSTDIDLDGLVANTDRQLEFDQPADRRHSQTLALPELEGRGVWVIDVLGGGQRSRALIQKGSLSSVEQIGDAGHILRIFDDRGEIVKTAHVELNDREFESDSEGRVLIPFSESQKAENILLVDGDFAVQEQLTLQSESYRLQAGFVIDRQMLVAGAQATLLVRTRLECNGRPISLKLLEKPQLAIAATDLDGISTTQTTSDLKLDDAGELVHKFLVPQRLASIQFTLSGRVTNQSLDRPQDVSATQAIQCNDINRTTLIGGYFLRETDTGYRVLVLGRNGEPLTKLPVTLAFNTLVINQPESLTLATDAQGELDLGPLPDVVSVSLAAQGVQGASLKIQRLARHWPDVVHTSSKRAVVLPLGSQGVETSTFTLTEIRRGAAYRYVTKGLNIGAGQLTIPPLTAGNYLLRDHSTLQQVRIAVVDAPADDNGHWIGSTRTLEIAQRQPLVISETSIVDKTLRIKLSGSDSHTRVHVLAHPFVPTLNPAQQSRFDYPPLRERPRRRTSSFYIDSLQLDEEYSYILQRQHATKYPGNLLPQPTLLVHPWEISLSENQSKEAAGGTALPSMAEPQAPAAAAPAPMSAEKSAEATASTSYDFLAQGTLVAANLKLNAEGQLVIPLEKLSGHSHIVILAVHPTTTDAWTAALPATELRKRDLRLKESFAPDVHLAEKQTVRVLKADEKVELGDARSSRVQLYTTSADVYRLYGTLLNNPEWEKFRFVTQWPQLSDEEKRARYSEMSCHELDFFLSRKDRKFFDAVVVPLLSQKLDKQLVDLWLLDKPLEGYRTLWRTQRLNTLERLLLAQRQDEVAVGTKRWLDEFIAAHPIDPVARSGRFETALRGTLLDLTLGKNVMFEKLDMLSVADAESLRRSGVAGGSGAMGALSDFGVRGVELEAEIAEAAAVPQAGVKLSLGAMAESKASADKGGADAFYFRADRLSERGRRLGRERFFQTLDQTREWAETQYYRVRLQQQTPELIPPGLFWQEFASGGLGAEDFLSQNMDLPVSSINEALCALAVLNLPWESPQPEMAVENDRLVVTTKSAAIAYVQSIEPAEASADGNSILAGEDLYLAEPHTDEESNRPLQDQPLLIGVPYRANVVVTNPSSVKKRVQVLCQLPAGAVPLAVSKITRSTTVELNPYSTAQVQSSFYFPQAGGFAHYGSQVSSDGKHLVATAHQSLRVLAEPESVDETTWSYIADWGTNEQVLAYLAKANLQRLDVSRIAFRLQDKAFYTSVVELLARAQRFDPALWAYALKHNDPDNIAQLLHSRPDFTGPLGPALDSRLITIDPQQQMSYEHLEYKPLVVARTHQLGSRRLIMNDRLFTQYSHLLNVLAHAPKISDDQRMELCYYLLLQNRIEESLDWFGQVEVANLATRLQYDYFDAYLDFYRGEYDRATTIAQRYAVYPVPRWRELFAQIGDHARQREALVAGQELTSVTALDSGLERDERLLTDRREAQQTRQSAESPALDLSVADGVAKVEFRNLDSVRINYYLMDIELLFSRNPFVSQSGDRLPAIRPNMTETIKLPGGAGGTRTLELPAEVRNRNVLVEVTAKGISRSSVLTANSLSVTVVEPYGRVQVRSRTDRAPVEAAYVKVYARHQDGSVRFFKDGYTDLRGQFDYATLSTSALDTVDRFAILVLHESQGAVVREAAIPTR